MEDSYRLYRTVATLGDYELAGDEGPEPGSDTGWNRELGLSRTRNLGAEKDTILTTSLGSHTREFVLRFSRTRFLLFKSLMGQTLTFVDWDGDEREVFVLSVRRDTSSRPFLYRTAFSLVEA